MAGVRLAIHATFVVELLILVTCSFLYATNKPHDPSLSAEPFFADQSGWKILVEDVSPAPTSSSSSSSTEEIDLVGRIIEQVGEISSTLMNQIYSLMGVESEAKQVAYHHKPRRVSSFVQEIRQQIATIHDVRSIDEVLPPLRFNLQMPQVISSATLNSLAESLAKGLQSQTTQSTHVPLIKVGVAESKEFSAIDDRCDNIQLQNIEPKLNINKREVKYPEIIIFMGCTNSANIPDEQMISVEVDGNSGIVIVRTKLSVDQKSELQNYLENEIPSKIVSNIFASPSKGYKLQSVSINLIDEDPSSYVTDETRSLGYTAKAHFNMIGKALSSSVESKISPLLEELSFVYGGRIEVVVGSDATSMMIISNNAIGLQVHSSAFVPIPNVPSIISNLGQNGDEKLKLVSSLVMANWLHTTQPRRRNSNNDATIPDYVEWTLLVPAAAHTPLVMFSDVGEGIAIVDKTENDDVYPSGLSIVNPLSFSRESHAGNVDVDQVHQRYKHVISDSLEYLVGCIRAIHGLPATSTVQTQHANRRKSQQLAFSFWELESIARSQYSKSLDIALHEMDVLLAVLYQHQSTLAFPVEVAYKLNNATHLLRQSISLIEQGYPTIYATSLIHGSLQYIESVQSDHRFHELPYFAIDHYLAVFSPLVLPLLLPMIAGLVREVKRFRELRRKS